VEGTVLNPNETPREKYIIRTKTGGEVILTKDLIKEVQQQSAIQQEYEKIRPKYPDTVDGQWALAEWCRERYQTELRRRHLERVIELDADHKRARAALGYQWERGEWRTRDSIMQSRGYVKDAAGAWRLPQEIEDKAKKDEQKRAEARWFAEIKRHRAALADANDPQGQADAARALSAIVDPNAVPVIKKQLEVEENPVVRKLYIQMLAQINTPAAIQLVARGSLEDPVEELRLTCLDFLAKEPRPAVTSFYVERLRSKDNVQVNRAAIALARMKDPAAIRPLIDALVTRHQFKVVTGGGPGSMGAGFGNDGGGSFSAGGGPRLVSRDIPNAAVRDALSVLSDGKDFDFNEVAWKNWYAAQKKGPALDARRGE
jgi:hypothetical protein